MRRHVLFGLECFYLWVAFWRTHLRFPGQPFSPGPSLAALRWERPAPLRNQRRHGITHTHTHAKMEWPRVGLRGMRRGEVRRDSHLRGEESLRLAGDSEPADESAGFPPTPSPGRGRRRRSGSSSGQRWRFEIHIFQASWVSAIESVAERPQPTTSLFLHHQVQETSPRRGSVCVTVCCTLIRLHPLPEPTSVFA